jgi:ketosteroid isomerase-like protein
MQNGKNINLVLEILKDEVKGDVVSALAKMDKKYSMTWMYKSPKGTLFPRSKPDFKSEMKGVYKIKGRKYDIKNIAEGKNLVMVELVESYPDSETKKVYRTPLVMVLEVKNGKILKGRHYCDPHVSFLYLTKKEVDKNF